MNRNNYNFYNKLPINDINWHVVLKNFPEDITEKELFNAIKNPYTPNSIILEKYHAIINYSSVKEAVESIRSNMFKKIKDKEIILHFNMSYLRKRAYRFSIFKVNLRDFMNHTYKSLYYHFVQYGDILGIEKVYDRRRIDIYYPSQGEAKLAEKNAKECSMEIFPNTSKIATDVISPFTENSQKLTNLAYAITIPVPSNSEDNTKVQSFSIRQQKNNYFNPISYSQKSLTMKMNNRHHQNFSNIHMRPSYHNSYHYYDIDDPMNGPYPLMDVNMDNESFINKDMLSPFHKHFHMNRMESSSKPIHKFIPEYNIKNCNKNQIKNNKNEFNNKVNKSNNDKNKKLNLTENTSYIPKLLTKNKNNNNKFMNSINNNNNNNNNNKYINLNNKDKKTNDNNKEIKDYFSKRAENGIKLNNFNEKIVEYKDKNKVKNLYQEKKKEIKDIGKDKKCKYVDNILEEKNQRNKNENKEAENISKGQNEINNKNNEINRIKEKKNSLEYCEIIDVENYNKRSLNNKEDQGRKRQKKDINSHFGQINEISDQNFYDNLMNLKKKYLNNGNYLEKDTNNLIKNIDNKINNNSYDSLKNKNDINSKKNKDDISLIMALNSTSSVINNKDSKIKIKYNTNTKKSSKNDNNKVISTSYNFVKFDNVTLSKYCYQYHFLYKYHCNKCCESIVWGGYRDCDDYKQYKLYIDNSDYSLSVLTTDLYSINNPAIVRQMAFDEVVNYKNINYIGDVEYERSMNHNLLYSQHSNVLLSNIDNQHYYLWNLKNKKYSSYDYNEKSILDLKEPSLKLQYNGILCDSITLSETSIFGLDFNGNLAKWNLDSISSINNGDKMNICSLNPHSVIKIQNNEKIKRIKTYINNSNKQENLIALSTNNNIFFYDLKNDNFKPINNIVKAHSTDITTIDINPINPFYVLTGGDDNYIKIWDLRNPNVELISACYYSNGINKLRWCPHLSNTFCCSSKNGIISIWSMNSLSENKPLMINNEYQSNLPIKVDFEWNPHKDQEGTIASVDKPGINNMRDSCVQVWRPLIYTYLYNGLIK